MIKWLNLNHGGPLYTQVRRRALLLCPAAVAGNDNAGALANGAKLSNGGNALR